MAEPGEVMKTPAELQAESFRLWIGGIDPAVTIEGRPDTIDAVSGIKNSFSFAIRAPYLRKGFMFEN